MITEEMKEALRTIIRDELSIEVDVGYDYNRRYIKVTLHLNGEQFSEWSDSLPTSEVSYL
jgi:hypothetical protein